MKKIVLMFLACAGMLSAAAQTTLQGSKATDNLSLGVNVGVTEPTTHNAVFKALRPVYGFELVKQVTPVLGFSVEALAGSNISESATAIDMLNAGLMSRINLNNLLSGYKGQARKYEVEAVVGTGWWHAFYPKTQADDNNAMYAKIGLNLNCNVGKEKALTIALKPAIVYNLCGGESSECHDAFNVNSSMLQLLAGVTYHFKNSNGTRNFKTAKLYDQAEVDGLNAKINDLRGNVQRLNGQISEKDKTIHELQNQLNDARNRTPQVVTKSQTRTDKQLESVVTFAQGKSVVDRSQLPNVERIATYMKNHKEASVVIKGYASPEGSAEANARIALARAEAVKAILISKYGIKAERIQAEGQGVGNMFSEPDWNRVSISTIKK